jgi:hypothetical protein
MATGNGPLQVTYRYAWYHRWFSPTFNFAALVWPVFLWASLATAKNPIVLSGNQLDSVVSATIFGFVVLVLTANFFPEIGASTDGLAVSFIFFHLTVRWEDIIDVRPSIFGWPGRPSVWVVRTRALTPFHRLYGLLYALKPEPSFIVSHHLAQHKDLLNRIYRRRFN